jgi:hypothetical protein
MVQFISAVSFFDPFLKDIKYEKDSFAAQLYHFFLRVGVIQKRPPMHEIFYFVRELGATHIERVFNGSSCVKLKAVDIITSCPLILSDCSAEHLRAITWSNDDKYNGKPKHETESL